MVWSDLCPSCCGDTGRNCMAIVVLLGEQIMARGPLVFISLQIVGQKF